MYLHMFDMVDTAFSYEIELIVWYFSRISPRVKEVACNLFAMHILCFYFVGTRFGHNVYVILLPWINSRCRDSYSLDQGYMNPCTWSLFTAIKLHTHYVQSVSLQSKSTGCALRINCKLLPLPLEKSWKNIRRSILFHS